jgi:hypothetical protein
MFEHRTKPLLPRSAFIRRLVIYICVALGIVLASLTIGIVGYHGFEGLSWIDATVNAAMILGGMGPVNELHRNAGKIFASAYALFSGVIFLIAVAVILAPVVHRVMHRFHLEMESQRSAKGESE